MKYITYGSDPELFLQNGAGRIIPCVGVIPGSKSKPHLVGGFGLQEDNVMVEFTTPPVCDPSELVPTARTGLATALGFVRTKLKDKTIEALPACSATFSRAELAGLGPQAMMFGCSPDFDAYSGGQMHPIVNPTQFDSGDTSLRFAGGHVHIGYKEALPGIPEHVVAMLCDLTIGLILCGIDIQGPRRTLYGKPGRYRPTTYGIEYRTVSNSWVVTPGAANAMSDAVCTFDKLMRLGEARLVQVYNEAPWHDVRAAIESDDYDETSAQILSWLSAAYFFGESEPLEFGEVA